jgi:bifunctional non-homologous end joining protein LigD
VGELKEYRGKRHLNRTTEPDGKIGFSGDRLRYVIQKHDASRLHYDLRLELDGVLKSWAVPKGPSLDPAQKRLAVQVEDHPLDYASFEGVIPKGEYGGGTVMVWDRGEWEPLADPHQGYRGGKLKLYIHGVKLTGIWTLARMRRARGDNNAQWLFVKHNDDDARPASEYDVARARPESVLSGRDIAAIAREPRAGRRFGARHDSAAESSREAAGGVELPANPGSLPGARGAAMPERIAPQAATLTHTPPAGDEWLHEIKYDGYRVLSFKTGARVRMLTRRGNDWTQRFAALASAIAALPPQNAIFDGEVVALTSEGRSDFQALQNQLTGLKGGVLTCYLFDLLYINGYDLTDTPLSRRKETLAAIIETMDASAGDRVRFSDHIAGAGEEVFARACELGLEGIVSKRADSRYQQRRSRSWLKCKCLHRQEFVICGYTEPGGARARFGALVLGYYTGAGRLIYAGRVGTGFNDRLLEELWLRLAALTTADTPFDKPPRGAEARGVHWVQPALVAEIAFAGWTDQDLLRQASFKGIREDKAPSEAIREFPRQPGARDNRHVSNSPSTADRPGRRPGKRIRIDSVSITNPSRQLYPDVGFNKADVAAYYHAVAERMLPYVANRPLALLRCPEGINAECFFQKHFAEGAPRELYTTAIKERDAVRSYAYVRDRAGLIALAQLATLEIHPWPSRIETLEHPDQLIFDLDPGDTVDSSMIVDAALIVRDALLAAGLQSFVKTSGGKGLHVVAPLLPSGSWRAIKQFAHAFARELERSRPRLFVSTMSKTRRRGKIYLDWVRNSRGATTVAPYSTRARPGAPVSTPLAWDELRPELIERGFSIDDMVRRFSVQADDPWGRFTDIEQTAPP